MIYSLNGKLIYTQNDMAVVECSGVGYAVRTSLSTLSRLPSVGENVFLYTYMAVREDAVDLFGFFDKEELNCFKMLISVSGVGAKAAISILSDFSPQKFALCIATGDAKSLTRSQGIGNKTAQRIVLELKDKIAKEQLVSNQPDMPSVSAGASNASEAISALVVLGYPQSAAAKAVSAMDTQMSVEEMIKQGLKLLASKL